MLIHISAHRIIPYNQSRLTFSALMLRMLLSFLFAVTVMPKSTAFVASSCCSFSSRRCPFLLRRLLSFGTMSLDIYTVLVLTDVHFLLIKFLQESLRAKIWWRKSTFHSNAIDKMQLVLVGMASYNTLGSLVQISQSCCSVPHLLESRTRGDSPINVPQ